MWSEQSSRTGRAAAGLMLALLLVGCGAKSSPAPADADSNLAALSYTRIFSDSSGVSHFGERDISFHYDDYAPPAAPLGASASGEAETLLFLTYPVGWVGDWHPAPRKQFVFILSGRVEVEVGDGEKRSFGSGDAILAADITGPGHIARTLGNKPAVSAVVAVTPD